MYGEAYILNLSVPRRFDGFVKYVKSKEMIDARTLLDACGARNCGDWSAPKWATVGDVVLFYQAVTSLSSVQRFLTLVDQRKHGRDYKARRLFLDDALELLPSINGSIFAVGRIIGPARNRRYRGLHMRGRVFANTGSVIVVGPPVPLDRFRDFITIRRAATITPLSGEQFERLRPMLSTGNNTRWLAKFSVGSHEFKPTDLRPWRERTCGPDVRFRHESMLCEHLIKPLLREICDASHPIFEEVVCYRRGRPTGRVDFWITLDGAPLPIEAKLSALGEDAIEDQIDRYLNVTEIKPRGSSSRQRLDRGTASCLVVDQHGLTIYGSVGDTGRIPVCSRRELATMDVRQIREKIRRAMSGDI